MSFEKGKNQDDLMLGMYVRCPVERRGDYDDDRYLYCRDFYMGQINGFDAGGDVHVIFHDPADIRQILSGCMTDGYWKKSELERVKPMLDTNALLDGREVTILDAVESDGEDKGFFSYYVRLDFERDKRIAKYREDELVLPFNRADFNPLQQVKSYELQAPRWYLQRRIASSFMNNLENVPFGIKNLIGTRVYLLPHQVDTIMRALAEKPCRLMLADEVGLGKTIEALSILKSMQDLSPDMKTLIVVPDTLFYQWQNEIHIKCWLDVDTMGSCNRKTRTLLLTYGEFVTSYKDPRVFLGNWDLLIVDETHRLLYDERMYRSVLIMSRLVKDVLLLSATPILHRGNEYHKLLSILNPGRFEKMDGEEFQELLDKQRNLQHTIFPLVRDLDDYLAYDDVPEEYIETLESINEDLHDARLDQIISEIDTQSEDRGLHMVKVALAYITEFYQIERGIIRHRRRDTVADGIKRSCERLEFDKGNAEFAVFEKECYENALDIAEDGLLSQGVGDISKIKRLMMAASSSPYALEKVMEEDGWEDDCLSDYCRRWKDSYDNEIVNMSRVSDDIDSFYSKLSRIIDHIDQEDYKKKDKVLIFTNFTCNIKKMYMGFENFFWQGQYRDVLPWNGSKRSAGISRLFPE
jgi:ATP-dependent helicase HepA